MMEFFLKQRALLGAGAGARNADLGKPGVQIGWRTPALAVAATAVLAISAHISIPLGFTPVPLTMQTFAVLLLAMLFSPRAAFATMVLYLAEGAAGLPVFSPSAGAAGLAHLLGPDGGYLLCYPFAAALASQVYRALSHHRQRGLAASFAGALSGEILILASGALWLGILTHASFSTVMAEATLPFLPGDAIKTAAAAICVSTFLSFRPMSDRPVR